MSHPAARRRPREQLLAGALLFFVSCGEREAEVRVDPPEVRVDPPPADSPSPGTPREPDPVQRLPERALEYEAVGEAEARIARAQEAVRARPAAATLDTLAALFYRRYRETGDAAHLRRAEDAIEVALEHDEHDPLALAMSGLILLTAHRFTDARDIARRILARDRHDTTAYILLGDAQLELGEYPAAVEAYQHAMDLRPDLRTYNRGAYARWIHGDVEGALELLHLAVEAGSARDPESRAWCLVDVANVHWHRGDRVRVRMALEQALSLMPDYDPALRLRARLEAAEGDRGAAIETASLLLSPQEHVGDLLYMSELLEAEGRTAEAEARLARAVEIAREDPRALALHRARRGLETEAALATLEAELTRRHDIYTLGAYAVALARSGRSDEARTTMDRALALETPDLGLVLEDALVRHLGGDGAGARAALERVRINPEVDRWLFDYLDRALSFSR